MNWQRRKRALRTKVLEKLKWQDNAPPIAKFLFKEACNLSLLCFGLMIYFCLYTAFGEKHRQGLKSTELAFPRKIWQSWKVDPTRFEERDAERARSWTMKNPALRYEVLTDGNGLAYVEQVFGHSRFNRPDIIQTYKSLNAKIVQADLLRYIIMYAEGGIWADIDVEAIRSFDHFVPKRYQDREQELDMIIGIETDEPDFKDHPVLGSKAQSFCQWIFVCKPQLPVMLQLIDNILIWLSEIAQREGKSISDIKLDFDEVLSGTGPSAFTNAILKQMSDTQGHRITWQHFHNLEESIVVGKILVLPSEAFAAGTGHSDSGNHGGKGALVKHHFHASSWTESHPRFKHPIYGEVEKCNWDVECVRLWDINTAFFNSLTPQEQSKMVAIKDLDERDMIRPESPAPGQIVLHDLDAVSNPAENDEQAPPQEASKVEVESNEDVLDAPHESKSYQDSDMQLGNEQKEDGVGISP